MFGNTSVENSSEEGTDPKSTVRMARGTYARQNSNNTSLTSLNLNANGNGSNENLAGIVNSSGSDAAANAGKTVKKV